MFYHGSDHKIDKFVDEFVGAQEATDQEGPGIYFTSSKANAAGYGRYVYTVELKPKKLLSVKEGQNAPVAELEWLIKQAPDWEMTVQNWHENPNVGLKKAVRDIIDANESPKEQFSEVWYDFFRYTPALYVRNMVKLGYDGFAIEGLNSLLAGEDNITHMIVFNPQIIKILGMEDNGKEEINEARRLIRGLVFEALEEHWECLNEEFDPFSHLDIDQEEDIDPEEDCVLTISEPNSKLGQIQAPSLSLPAGYSCPFAKVCKSLTHRHGKKAFDGKAIKDYGDIRCYASSAEVAYPAVRNMRWRNYDLLRSVGKKGGARAMADLLVRSLRHYEQNHGAVRVFRIHDSGDFFSPEYLDAWIECAKAMPGVLFYAYTKSLSFWASRKSEIPKNLRLIASEGGKEDELIDKEGFRKSVIVKDSGEAIKRNLNIDVNDFLAAFGDKDFALLLHGVQSAESGQTKQSFANSKIIKNAAAKFQTSPGKIERLIKMYID